MNKNQLTILARKSAHLAAFGGLRTARRLPVTLYEANNYFVSKVWSQVLPHFNEDEY